MKTKEILREIERLRDQINDLEGRVNGDGFEVGRVYKYDTDCIVCYAGDGMGYGFWEGEWDTQITINEPEVYTEATEEEWLNALKKEAVRRGFVDGCSFKSIRTGCVWEMSGDINFGFRDGELRMFSDYGKNKTTEFVRNHRSCGVIMKKGQWAEIVDEPSPEPVKKRELLNLAEMLEEKIKELKALL